MPCVTVVASALAWTLVEVIVTWERAEEQARPVLSLPALRRHFVMQLDAGRGIFDFD